MRGPHPACTPGCRTCVSARVCVQDAGRSQRCQAPPRRTPGSLGASDIFTGKRTRPCSGQKLGFPPLKTHGAFSRRQSAAAATLAGAAASGGHPGTKQKVRNSLRWDGERGLHQVAGEGPRGTTSRAAGPCPGRGAATQHVALTPCHPLHPSPSGPQNLQGHHEASDVNSRLLGAPWAWQADGRWAAPKAMALMVPPNECSS